MLHNLIMNMLPHANCACNVYGACLTSTMYETRHIQFHYECDVVCLVEDKHYANMVFLIHMHGTTMYDIFGLWGTTFWPSDIVYTRSSCICFIEIRCFRNQNFVIESSGPQHIDYLNTKCLFILPVKKWSRINHV